MNDPLLGQQLGDYTIQTLLGKGGMARVYRGYDERLDRYAAVKVIEPNLVATDEEIEDYKDRFQREARAIARLNHPNIVTIYQFGQDETETLYYMAMGFLNGQDLRHILKDTNKQSEYLSDEQVLRICRDIASALDYAHEQGVIHRDVKPSNIMVTDDGRAVLTDFGLALNAQEGTIGNTFGSVHYIAPEQAVSSARAVPQSDLYSLGVVLFEMLTGRVPFEDVSAMSVALRHISDPPPRPSAINPEITPEIEAVIMTAMDKDPERRFQTGQEFAKALAESLTTRNPIEKTSPQKRTAEMDRIEKAASGWDEWDNLATAKLDQIPPEMMQKKQQSSSRTALFAIIAILIILLLGAGALFAGGVFDGSSTGEDSSETPPAAVIAEATEEPTDTPEPTEESTTEHTEAPSATHTATVEPTTEPTVKSPDPTVTLTVTPIPSNTTAPTETETPDDRSTATATYTAMTPTETPDITATPAIFAESDDEPQILLRYDGDSLVLFNRSPSTRLNISDLTFIGIRVSGSTARFQATTWGRNINLFSLRPADCFQVLHSTINSLPADEFPADICNFRQGFFSTVNTFWVSSDPERMFEVRQDDTVLATCPTVLRSSEGEARCLVNLRTDDDTEATDN